jgi:hypothetical protein
MSKTPTAAAEYINADDEVNIDSIDWKQERRDADRLFTDWVDVEVEVLSCTLPAPAPVPAIEESRYFLRSSLKVSTFKRQTPCLCLSTALHH